MVKKSKRKLRKVKRYAGKTEKEWKEWGEEFGGQMEKLGKEFGRHIERRGKEWENEWWWSFGLLGPFIGSIFGIIFLVFGLWLLNLINVFRISFISMLSSTVFANLHWFFAAFLFFGYGGYFSKKIGKDYWIFSPIISSIGIVFALWISTLVINLINFYANNSALAFVSNLLYSNLLAFFFLFLVLLYVAELINKSNEGKKWKK